MAATDAFEGLAELLRGAATEAVVAAEDAAAKVYRQAISAAAPRDSGQLAGSIRTFESRDRKVLTGNNRKRVLVGPDKPKGYYGFFLDRGYTATGPYRLVRKAHGTTHSQRGAVLRGRKIPGTHWFENAVRSADSAAEAASTAAFNDKLSELNSRI